MNFNFIDFYIGYPGHPRFKDTSLIEDDVIQVIVQKYEMILFTNKGEVFGEPDFGANLEELLYETRLSSEYIEGDIKMQIQTYIEEIKYIDYTLKVTFYEDPERFQEYMEVLFQIKDYDVYAVIA
jgi:hypothetical protein